MKKKIVVIGAGGHASVIIDILNKNDEYEIIGCLDKSCGENKKILGYDVIGNDDLILDLYHKGIKNAFVALGNIKRRYEISQVLQTTGFTLINVICKSSYISDFAEMGWGTAVMPGAVISTGSVIGNNVIVNTNASVDHDCNIGDNCNLSPGVNLAGRVNIGEGTFLGTGCKVRDGIKIGKECVIGMGSVVVKNIPDYSLVYGVPAKVQKIIK